MIRQEKQRGEAGMYTVLLVDDEDDVTQIIMKKVPAKLRIIAEAPGRKLQQER